ncbi:MAG: hypothetical protein R3F33_12675 [Planctomycetota bacterium]
MLMFSLALLGPLTLPQPLSTDAVTLKTDYSGLKTLVIERTVDVKIETTAMEIEVDGEKRDTPGRGMGSTEFRLSQSRKDSFKAFADGKPSKLRRTFVEMGGTRVDPEDGEVDMEMPATVPQEGLVIDITVQEDGTQKIEVVEGKAPENPAFMERQPLTLAVDHLLPTEELEVDGTYTIEAGDVRIALGELFPPRAPRPEGMEAGGPRRERSVQDGRRRRMGGGFGGAGIGQFLASAEWEGEGKLVSLDKEYEGQSCAVIELTIKADGELPEGQFGGGRQPRERAFFPPTGPLPVEGEIGIEWKGKLYFSLEHKAPVALQLEGHLNLENNTTREGRNGTMSMHMEQEGTLKLNCSFERIDD